MSGEIHSTPLPHHAMAPPCWRLENQQVWSSLKNTYVATFHLTRKHMVSCPAFSLYFHLYPWGGVSMLFHFHSVTCSCFHGNLGATFLSELLKKCKRALWIPVGIFKFCLTVWQMWPIYLKNTPLRYLHSVTIYGNGVEKLASLPHFLSMLVCFCHSFTFISIKLAYHCSVKSVLMRWHEPK